MSTVPRSDYREFLPDAATPGGGHNLHIRPTDSARFDIISCSGAPGGECSIVIYIPFQSKAPGEKKMDDIELKVNMTEKALRQGYIGGRHVPVEAVVRISLPVHARGRGQTLLEDEMIPKAEAGWAYYGATGTVHITDTEAAVEFIEDNGGDVPFNFQ